MHAPATFLSHAATNSWCAACGSFATPLPSSNIRPRLPQLAGSPASHALRQAAASLHVPDGALEALPALGFANEDDPADPVVPSEWPLPQAAIAITANRSVDF